jgi:hypothetical protein
MGALLKGEDMVIGGTTAPFPLTSANSLFWGKDLWEECMSYCINEWGASIGSVIRLSSYSYCYCKTSVSSAAASSCYWNMFFIKGEWLGNPSIGNADDGELMRQWCTGCVSKSLCPNLPDSYLETCPTSAPSPAPSKSPTAKPTTVRPRLLLAETPGLIHGLTMTLTPIVMRVLKAPDHAAHAIPHALAD